MYVFDNKRDKFWRYAGHCKMAAPETQVPGTRSPPHYPSATPAPDRGKRCRCGILPDRKAALEHREDGATGKRTTAPALNRGKCCRCGGGRMVAWVRMENLPRSGLPKESNSLTGRFMVCLFMSRGLIRRYITFMMVIISQLEYVCVFHK